MGDYLEAYAAGHAPPVQTSTRVDRLERADGDDGTYHAHAGNRLFHAPNVIVASGALQRARVPAFAAELDPRIRQLHSGDYRNPGQIPDGPTLVVGLSHSGSDIAVELAATRTTYLSGRRHGQIPVSIETPVGYRLLWWMLKLAGSTILTVRTPVGRRMAKRFRAGGAPLLRNRMPELRRAGVIWQEARTVGVRDGLPALADGTVLNVRSVVWCTGFAPDYSWVRLPITGEDGWPRQDRGIIADAPGLYVLGMPFLSGFTSVLVLGADRDARHVVEHIRRRLPTGAAAA
jgi:putative flavoprotein involved in K+ transport